MKKQIIIVVILVLVMAIFVLSGCFEEENNSSKIKSAPIYIINECSDVVEVKIEFDMYDYDINTDSYITQFTGYKNISIEPGKTWNYIFNQPESIDSEYLGVNLYSVRCGKFFTSFSQSSKWFGRRDDSFRIYESNNGINVEFLD